jgi:transcriptional regulator with XRE-family HTH domain
MDLAQRLKSARLNCRLSQTQLAIKIGVSDKTISGYESGRIDPPLSKIRLIAKTLNISINYLIGNDSAPHNIAQRLNALEAHLKQISSEIKKIRIESSRINK